MALQIRRGTEAQRLALSGVDVPALGELLYTTDTKQLYIGDGVTTGGKSAGYFGTVSVDGQWISADNGNSSLTIEAGTAITLTPDTVTNTVTIAFNGENVTSLNVGESYAADPVDSYVDFEGSGPRLMRMGANVSTFDPADSPYIQIAAYRASPANNNGGPKIEFRQSTVTSMDEVIANIKSVVTNVANGAESGKLVFSVVDASDVVSIDSTGVVGNLTGDVTGDVTGNVYAIDTTLLVDAANGILTGELVGNVTGDVKGSVFADDSTVLVDGPAGVLRGELVGTLTGTVTTPNLTISNDTISTITSGNDIVLSAVGGSIVARGNLFSDRIDLLLDPTVGGVGVYNTNSTNSMISLIQAHSSQQTTQSVSIPGTSGGPINGSTMTFIRGRGTLLSLQSVQAQDDLGSITFAGFEGTGFPISANISATVPFGGTISTGIVQGTLNFQVADSTGNLGTKMVVGAERVSVTKPFNLVTVSTTQRNALTPAFGDMIYNTTLNKFQGYQNTGGTTPEWVDLS